MAVAMKYPEPDSVIAAAADIGSPLGDTRVILWLSKVIAWALVRRHVDTVPCTTPTR